MDAFTLAAVAALLWGMAAFCEKMGLSGGDPLAALWVRNLSVFAGGMVLTFFIPQLPAKLAGMGWRSAAWVAAGGVLASVVGQVFFYRALKMGDIGRVASVGGSWPLVAFILSMIFLNEPPTARKILGVALIFSGVSLLK